MVEEEAVVPAGAVDAVTVADAAVGVSVAVVGSAAVLSLLQ